MSFAITFEEEILRLKPAFLTPVRREAAEGPA